MSNENFDRYRNIPDQNDTNSIEGAKNILENMVFDHIKFTQRQLLLQNEPQLRIRIDTIRLRTIIPYIEFKCHPRSSIARDKAIKGSDIDGGLVVVENPISNELQELFVVELRNQGFSVFTEQKAQEAAQKFNLLSPVEQILQHDLRDEIKKINLEKIVFRTLKQLEEEQKIKGFTIPVLIFLAGKTIQ